MPRALILLLAGVLSLHAEPLQEFRLPNGLRVLLAENHERPLVRLELRTAWDPAEEPAGKAGLGGFLADLLKSGAGSPLRHEAFTRFLEGRALRVSFAPLPRAYAWSVLADSQGQDGAFEGLALAATRPDFEPAAVEVRRQQLLQAARQRSARQLAEDRFRRRVGDPAGSPLPEEGALIRIEYQDLLGLAKRVLRPERSVLAIHGDMNLAQARQLSMLHLGAWGPSPQAPLAAPPVEPTKAVRTWLVREPGRPLLLRVGSSQPMDAAMLAAPLAICTRLIQRDLAAGLPPPLLKAAFQVFPGGGWVLEASAAPGAAVAEAMTALRGLLARLGEKRIEPGEWSAARQAWNMDQRTRGLHPQLEAEILANEALKPMGLEDHLGLAEVQTALKPLLAPEACSYLIVGATGQEAPWLAQAGFGPVEVVN